METTSLPRFMFERGWFGDLLSYTDVALQVLNNISESQSLEAALILNTIGNYYLEATQPAQAEKYYTDTLNIRQKILPADDPVVSNSMHNLAFVYGGLGDYMRAKNTSEAALAIVRDYQRLSITFGTRDSAFPKIILRSVESCFSLAT
jgi:tetratricopeptide (TPR) repeat protein